MGGNHNLYCSGNQPDIVERLRSTELQNWALDKEAADEIERLRDELASCIEDLDREVRVGNDYMEQLAKCERERDEWKRAYEAKLNENGENIRKLAKLGADKEAT